MFVLTLISCLSLRGLPFDGFAGLRGQVTA
jgi:hypothetical protein